MSDDPKSNVVSLFERDPRNGPWIAAAAHCLVCGHKWAQVSKPGSTLFDCSACRRETGVLTTLINLPDGRPRLVCEACGMQLWRVAEDGLLCAVCGVERAWPL